MMEKKTGEKVLKNTVNTCHVGDAEQDDPCCHTHHDYPCNHWGTQ